jgi:hypothetical protein
MAGDNTVQALVFDLDGQNLPVTPRISRRSLTLLKRASTCSDPAHTLRQALSEPVRAPVT